jgi:16S rRNA processing protein RimM
MRRSPMPDHSIEGLSEDLSMWDVLVGRVVGRWDRASLKIAPIDASENRFAAGSKLCLETPDGARRLVGVLSSKAQGKSWVCDCGLSTLEQAEALLNSTLWVHRSMRPVLPEGEFYLDEVLGLRVQTQSGEDWGEVEEVLETPAHNVYVTRAAMIPAHPEFIVETDWNNRVLIVRDVPELKTVADNRLAEEYSSADNRHPASDN